VDFDETICEALTRLSDHLDVDLVMLGAYGVSRGSQPGDGVHILGSVADHSLRTCQAHVGLVRSTAFDIESTAKILVPVDFSDNSGEQVSQTRMSYLIYTTHLGSQKASPILSLWTV
jgi:hypothetical protein